jgi:protein SCO1/2
MGAVYRGSNGYPFGPKSDRLVKGKTASIDRNTFLMSKMVLLFLLVIAFGVRAFAHDEQRSPEGSGAGLIANDVTLEQRLNTRLPLDPIFTDESGRQVPLKRYFDGKPVLLALVYYDCPRLCPLVLDGIVRSLRPLNLDPGKDFRVVAISIDPQETHELARKKKRALMTRYSRPGSQDGWHLLTGEQASIDAVAEAVGFRYSLQQNRDIDRFAHAAGIMVITPEGRTARYFYGFDYPPRDLRFALIEASGNRIGSRVDQLLLLCYKYDPAQGKYTVAIMNVLRLSAVATVASLGGFLCLMLKRERRNKTGPRRTHQEAH